MLFIAIIFITGLWILTSGLRPWHRVAAAAGQAAAEAHMPEETTDTGETATSEEPTQRAGEKPQVSIVAYIHRDEEELSPYIDMLLGQRCPGLEVVLVCDASAEATAMISERFENVSNLHITFVPPGSHNLSRRKLAQTIGIKAAKGEIVLLTASSVHPVSPYWAEAMTKELRENPSVAVTLGYVRPVTSDYTGGGKWYRMFDHTIDTVSWMAAALSDDAFRGDGYDMAIRRRAFFDNKGYAATLPLMDGDDDIFIRELSRFGRVTLCLNPDAVVDSHWGDQTDRRHLDLKDRRMFTRHYLPPRPFVRLAMMSAAQWLLLLSLIGVSAAAIAGWYFPAISAAIREACGSLGDLLIISPALTGIAFLLGAWVAGILIWTAEAFGYRRVATALGSARLFWPVPLFLLWRPIGNLLFGINHRTGRRAHFTWQR